MTESLKQPICYLLVYDENGVYLSRCCIGYASRCENKRCEKHPESGCLRCYEDCHAMKRVIVGSNTCLPRSNYFYLWCEGNISDKIPNFAQIMSQDETMNTTKPKSIYRYGAEYGLYMGLFLTVISLCFVFSLYRMEASIAIYPLLLIVPAVLWFMMVRLYIKEPLYRINSALWMFGICVFFFGSLICGGVTLAYLSFVEPTFFSKYATMTADFISSGPLASQYESEVELLRNAVERNQLPTSADFVISMMWTTVFMGSVTSMIMAPLVRLVAKKRFNENNENQ